VGITFFDTADMYGDGRSERLIAKALKNHYCKLFVATKVGHNFYAGDYRKDFGKEYLRFAAEQSLKRLSTERIDLLQLHNPSEEVLRRGEPFDVLNGLAAEGKIRFWGISVSSAESARLAIAGGTATLQLVHNLLRPQLLQAIGEEAKNSEIGIIVRTPLEYGLLSGKFRKGHIFQEHDHRAKRWGEAVLEKRLAQVESFRFLVKGETGSLSEAALRYVLADRLVSVVIPGIKTCVQLEELLKAARGKYYLDPEDRGRIALLQERLSDLP